MDNTVEKDLAKREADSSAVASTGNDLGSDENSSRDEVAPGDPSESPKEEPPSAHASSGSEHAGSTQVSEEAKPSSVSGNLESTNQAASEMEAPATEGDTNATNPAIRVEVSFEELQGLEEGGRQHKTLMDNYTRLNRLIAFKREHGNLDVADEKLKSWLQRLRDAKEDARDGKRPKHFTPRLEKLLTDLGFPWERRSKRGESGWNDRYEELKRFNDAHGHLRVPTRPEGPESRLGRWVTEQRKKKKQLDAGEFRGAKLEEVKEQIKKLDELGFVWSAKPGSGT